LKTEINTTRNITQNYQILARFGCKLTKGGLDEMAGNKRHFRLINKCRCKTL